jgi:hypothetical protein
MDAHKTFTGIDEGFMDARKMFMRLKNLFPLLEQCPNLVAKLIGKSFTPTQIRTEMRK